MRNNFTNNGKLISRVLSIKKNIALFLTLVIIGIPTILNAQMEVNSTGMLADSLGADLDGVHILFVSLTPLNSGGTDIDASFTLSNGPISVWDDYSISVRFNNHQDEFIDARDGGAFNADTQIVLVFNQLYYLWLEIDVPNKKYSVHLDDTEGLSDPIKLASGYAFRKSDIDKLKIWSVLIQGSNHLDISRLALVNAVGQFPGEETDVQTIESISDLSAYPNPFRDQVKIELDGYFEYSVYNLGGALILEGISNGKCVVGKDLAQGYYLLKINQNSISKTLKLVKY